MGIDSLSSFRPPDIGKGQGSGWGMRCQVKACEVQNAYNCGCMHEAALMIYVLFSVVLMCWRKKHGTRRFAPSWTTMLWDTCKRPVLVPPWWDLRCSHGFPLLTWCGFDVLFCEGWVVMSCHYCFSKGGVSFICSFLLFFGVMFSLGFWSFVPTRVCPNKSSESWRSPVHGTLSVCPVSLCPSCDCMLPLNVERWCGQLNWWDILIV